MFETVTIQSERGKPERLFTYIRPGKRSNTLAALQFQGSLEVMLSTGETDPNAVPEAHFSRRREEYEARLSGSIIRNEGMKWCRLVVVHWR